MISFQQALEGFKEGMTIGARGSLPSAATKSEERAVQKWALVLADGTAINFTSIIQIDVDSTNKVINAPTETAFATYNKAIGPTLISMTASFAGSDSERQIMTEKLLALSGDMSLLLVVTPETVFKNMNVESVTYSRKSDDGVNIIYFDIGLVEVRVIDQQFTNVNMPKKKKTGKKNGEESAAHGAMEAVKGWF